MAHMAEIKEVDGKWIVQQVLVIPDSQEYRGEEYLRDELGLGGKWVRTSYNNRIRMNYAGPGYTYDPVEDWFVAPQPYPSWILTRAAQWVAPVKYPDDGLMYRWNEELTDWEVINYDN